MAAFTGSLETGIYKALKNADGIDSSGLDSARALLHVAKRRTGCDLMIANFSRRFVARSSDNDVDIKATQERICTRLLECPELKPFVECCSVTSPAGHLTIYLNRRHVMQKVLNSIVDERENYGRPENPTSIHVLLHDTVLMNSSEGCCEHLSLDQLRTTLLVEHVKETLKWAGASVQLLRSDNISESRTSACEHVRISENLLSAFVNSPPDVHVDKEKVAHARQGICNAMNHCGYTSQSTLLAMKACNSERTLENSCSACQSILRNSDNQDQEGRSSIAYSVDVGQYLLDNKCLCEVYDKNLQRSKVPVTEDMLNHIVCLETIATEIPPQQASLMLHVLPSRLQFRYQQKGLLWHMLSQSSVAQNQQYLCHGPVITSSKNEEERHSQIHARELLEIRKSQLKEAFTLKYGDVVGGTGWQDSITAMAITALKLEILSVSLSSTVKINLSGSAQEFRQATFVMYNCARLAKLFQKYEQSISKGIYPALPHVSNVDFSLLKDEAEWHLFLHYIFKFPSVVQEASHSAWAKSSVNMQLQTHKITSFLFDLSHEFSSYYGRIHVLVEPREHLFPTMFARLYLMKGIQQVIHNCLELLNIKPLTQM